MKGVKVLLEGQMRRQAEVQETLRAHAGSITREVCLWTKRYINAKFVVFGDHNGLKVCKLSAKPLATPCPACAPHHTSPLDRCAGGHAVARRGRRELLRGRVAQYK